MTKALEGLTWGTRERVEREDARLGTACRVEERAELGAAELRGGVGHRLDDDLELQLRGEHRPGRVEQLEDARLLLERFLHMEQIPLGASTRAQDALDVLQYG